MKIFILQNKQKKTLIHFFDAIKGLKFHLVFTKCVFIQASRIQKSDNLNQKKKC
jgi:hypothetical protein